MRVSSLMIGAVAFVVGLAGCAGAHHGASAENAATLNRLATEPIFQNLPPDTHPTGPARRTPASSRPPGFDGGGQSGPAVTLTMVSNASPQVVFQFFTTRAEATGWQPNGNRNILGYPEVWTKPYGPGTTASLSLIDLSIEHPAQPATYVLNASA